jgi:hypothetical protein
MSGERWIITGDADWASERIPVGPEGDTLPRWFNAAYRNLEDPDLTLHLRCRFPGERVVVDEVTLKGANGRTITPRDMATMEVGRAVLLAAGMFAEPGKGACHLDDRPDRRPTKDELRHVAAIYAFSHASWGKPREAVMRVWQIPRSTANRWIRKARELFPEHMPRSGDFETDN